MAELEGQQLTAANLLAVNPGMTKTELAQLVGVSKSTLYAWLATDRFQRQIEGCRVTPRVNTDPETVMETLSEAERDQALRILTEQEHRPTLVDEVDEAMGRLVRRVEAIGEPRRYQHALEEIGKLIGRFEIALGSHGADAYNPDGSRGPVTLKAHTALAVEVMELLVLQRGLGLGYDPEEWEIAERWVRALEAAQSRKWPTGWPACFSA